MREILHLNYNWNYIHTASKGDLAAFNDGGETVSLPHTTALLPYNYLDERAYQTVCAYQKRLTLPERAEGKRVFLIVGAAAHSARVYADGALVGSHTGGYTAFTVELTGKLVPGRESLLTILVDSREDQNIPPFGNVIDYLTYGGLYREVRLELREESFLRDVFVLPELKDGSGIVNSRPQIENPSGCTVKNRVLFGGEVVAAGETPVVPNPQLWDTDSPHLYTLETALLKNGEVIDCVTTRFGFRTAVFCKDGFYLNGRKIKLRGLNRHQSYPYVGYAMPASMQRYDAEILKNELGVNAVRTSHYPQSPHFIDRCDELGLLVFTEIPGWQHIGDKEWQDIAVENVHEMVTQYRNHPSIILWGVRINESHDNDAFYRRTNDIAHALDNTRQTSGVRCYKRSSLLEDVYAYNDFVHEGDNPGCEPKQAVTSNADKPYFISEYNGHMYPCKSFDDEEQRLAHAMRHARVLNDVAGKDDICGSFGWCMFDYNTHRDFGSGDRICYHGVLDMFRNKKLAADVYASQGEQPVLTVSSSMDMGEHPKSSRGRVMVFTNADSVRFYKNDRLIREFKAENAAYPHLAHPPVPIDDFIGDQLEKEESFAPRQAQYVRDILNESAVAGVTRLSDSAKRKAAYLKWICRMNEEDLTRLYGKYIGGWGDRFTVFRFEAVKNGETVATAIKTPPVKRVLRVTVSHTALTEGATYDVAALRIVMTDENGNVLPFFNGAVRLQTEGAVTVIGDDPVILRGGMGGTYIKTAGQSGKVSLTLSAQGCEPVTVPFTVTKEKM